MHFFFFAGLFKAGERNLRDAVESLFQSYNTSIVYNSRKRVGLSKDPESTQSVFEIDVWIHDLNIGFEYQVGIVLCVYVRTASKLFLFLFRHFLVAKYRPKFWREKFFEAYGQICLCLLSC